MTMLTMLMALLWHFLLILELVRAVAPNPAGQALSEEMLSSICLFLVSYETEQK